MFKVNSSDQYTVVMDVESTTMSMIADLRSATDNAYINIHSGSSYSNFNNGDHSKNTSPWGILLMGELFQNNHHYAKDDANFAKKWYEFDLTFFIMRGLHAIRIIKLVPVGITENEPVPVCPVALEKLQVKNNIYS